MANGYSKQIQEQIKAAAEGTIFISSDFADIADTETIRRNLNRLTQAGMLRRILKGVYEKPKYSKLLDEYVAADPEAVANALARSYHWTIAPCGNTALNLLGLSTQVTAVDDPLFLPRQSRQAGLPVSVKVPRSHRSLSPLHLKLQLILSSSSISFRFTDTHILIILFYRK